MKQSVWKVVVVAVTLGAWGGFGWAEEIKIGVVDLQQVFTKSKKGAEINQKMQNLVNTTKAGLEKSYKELTSLKDEIERSGPMMKEEARNEKIKAFKVKEMELQMAEQEAKNKISNEQRELEQVFAQEVQSVIDTIRIQRNLLLVLSSQFVVSKDHALDITDEVIRAYDAATVSKSSAPASKAPSASPPSKTVAPVPAKK